MEPKVILLELQYLPPVQYFAKFFQYETVFIEHHEHYSKRSYRNRCHIATATGIQRLSVPLAKGKNEQQAISAVQISYDENWQKKHWSAIQTAYSNAPFFEHYEAFFQPFFTKEFEFLFDWNRELLKTILQMPGFDKALNFTTLFQKETPDQVLDFRSKILPNPGKTHDDPSFKPMKYAQVFEEKSGFIPNLSILDLIFCTGPQAPYFLENSIII